jgi:hypothetical protein
MIFKKNQLSKAVLIGNACTAPPCCGVFKLGLIVGLRALLCIDSLSSRASLKKPQRLAVRSKPAALTSARLQCHFQFLFKDIS